jgi:hypothetical protein
MRCGESNGSRRRKTKHGNASLATSAAFQGCFMRGNGSAGAGFRGVLPQWRFEIVEAASWKRKETRGVDRGASLVV